MDCDSGCKAHPEAVSQCGLCIRYTKYLTLFKVK
jgi:hypothetical protein